ncbi:MAG: hypothetical protein KJP23_19890, partial [Deltaproteobacteria bacterium]|nr:hypothetical protein [Deltaproteobacteria bacterium]
VNPLRALKRIYFKKNRFNSGDDWLRYCETGCRGAALFRFIKFAKTVITDTILSRGGFTGIVMVTEQVITCGQTNGKASESWNPQGQSRIYGLV